MKRLLLISFIFLLLSVSLDAQLWKTRRYEVSVGLGTTQFFGDIGGFSQGKNLLGLKDLIFLNTRYNISLNARYRIMQKVSVRLNVATGKFHSTDIKGSNENRDFSSSTSFFESAAIGEYYFIKNRLENSFIFLKGQRTSFQSLLSSIDCYAFTGVGAVSYSVTPNDLLAPRATDLKGFTPVIPLGIGIKMVYSPNFDFGLELGARYSFTDKLDGYTSEFSKSNDIYHFFNITFTYKIKTDENGRLVFGR